MGIEHTQIVIQNPLIVWMYYLFNDLVDRHNRLRQDSLNLEKKVEVKEWSFRLITSLLGIIVINAYLMHKNSRVHHSSDKYSIKMFIRLLAGEMIRNTLDETVAEAIKKRRESSSPVKKAVLPTSIEPHRIVTKEIVKEKKGDKVYSRKKRLGCAYCSNGRARVSFVCSLCPTVYICDKNFDNACMNKHKKEIHSIEVE